MKILFKGLLFNPCGIPTANRGIVKAVDKLKVPIQVTDTWHDLYDFNKGLEHLNSSININDSELVIIHADYPQYTFMNEKGIHCAYFLHEGTKLHPGWSEHFNKMDFVIVPSNATKSLFRWNDIWKDIYVVPYGIDPKIYEPKEFEKDENFIFLSINSWTGLPNDRKGTDLLIKAFDEEFKEDEKVRLVLKFGTFWQQMDNEKYMEAILNLLGHQNKNIVFESTYYPEDQLAELYQRSDCFVSPTKAEAFGLTILQALACGCPTIVTKDSNSGHMDFCKGLDSVLWIDTLGVEQANLRFYAQGNMQPIIDLESLKKQMRFAFEHREELEDKATFNSQKIRENWSWTKSAEKLISILKEEVKKNGSIDKSA